MATAVLATSAVPSAPDATLARLQARKQRAREALHDNYLVSLARGGDTLAFEQLVNRHQDTLFSVVMRFTRNEQDAQDILQEVFLSAWRNLSTFEGRSQLSTWLYRLSVNASLMWLRSHNRRREVPTDDLENATQFAGEAAWGGSAGSEWSNRPDERLESEEWRRRIQTSLRDLPDSMREVLVIRGLEGRSTTETARALGLTTPAVKTRLHRARAALRACMS